MMREVHLRALQAAIKPLASMQSLSLKPTNFSWSDVSRGLEVMLKSCDAARAEKKDKARVDVFLDPDLPPRAKAKTGKSKKGSKGRGSGKTTAVPQDTESGSSSPGISEPHRSSG